MKLLKSLLFVFIFLIISTSLSLATHLKGGEITYEFEKGKPTSLVFTVKIYIHAHGVDQSEILVDFGDGTSQMVKVNSRKNLGNQIEETTFRAGHVYAGPGSYVVSCSIPNRNSDIVNFSTPSDQLSFSLQTRLVINPLISNNLPIYFADSPIWFAEIGKTHRQNILAFDPDGDSLSFRMITPLGTGNAGYFFPDSLILDAATGELIWHSPKQMGEFSFAAEVTEWKKGIAVGSVIRDFQVFIREKGESAQQLGISQSSVPALMTTNKVRVEAGSKVDFTFFAKDSGADSVQLQAYSILLNENSGATLTIKDSLNVDVANFTWQTPAAPVQKNPYVLVIRARSFVGNQIIESDYTISFYIGTEVGQEPQLVMDIFDPSLSELSLQVFPNPAGNSVFFKLKGEESMDSYSLLIVDALGREKIKTEFSGMNPYGLDIRNLHNGWYIYYIWSKKGRRYSGRLMKL